MQTLKFLFLCISTKFFLFFKGFECQTLAFRGVKGYLVSIVSKYTQFILHSYTLYKQTTPFQRDIREQLNLSKYLNSSLEKDAKLTKANIVPPILQLCSNPSFLFFITGKPKPFIFCGAENNTPSQIPVQLYACSTIFPLSRKMLKTFFENSSNIIAKYHASVLKPLLFSVVVADGIKQTLVVILPGWLTIFAKFIF